MNIQLPETLSNRQQKIVKKIEDSFTSGVELKSLTHKNEEHEPEEITMKFEPEGDKDLTDIDGVGFFDKEHDLKIDHVFQSSTRKISIDITDYSTKYDIWVK